MGMWLGLAFPDNLLESGVGEGEDGVLVRDTCEGCSGD